MNTLTVAGLAKVQELDYMPLEGGQHARLFKCPAGTYLAGSGTREQLHTTFLVTVERMGNPTVGQHYRNEIDARAVWSRLLTLHKA